MAQPVQHPSVSLVNKEQEHSLVVSGRVTPQQYREDWIPYWQQRRLFDTLVCVVVMLA